MITLGSMWDQQMEDAAENRQFRERGDEFRVWGFAVTELQKARKGAEINAQLPAWQEAVRGGANG